MKIPPCIVGTWEPWYTIFKQHSCIFQWELFNLITGVYKIMKNQRFRLYINWGLTALAVIACSILFAFALLKAQTVFGVIGEIIQILMPIIYGGVLAYLMLPVYNFVYFFVCRNTKKIFTTEKVRSRIGKMTATIITLLFLFMVVCGLFWMIIPQILESILGFQESLAGYISNLTLWLSQLLQDNPQLEEAVMPHFNEAVTKFQYWMTTDLVPSIYLVLDHVSAGVINVVTVVKNILIGLIVMIYFLNLKWTLCAQFKKMIYGLFRVRMANRLINEMRFAHRVFGGFITGKLLDSLIIGIMCFFGMQFLKMPYVLLISVIIGVTNVIPFFGPFFGAVPSAFLILLVSPVKCLYFLIFVLVLQQFDGNILGPKILGDSTGLPSFWVLFSILLFGGLFGFVGMIIAVPAFAVFYRLVSEYICGMLRRKNLSARTDDYRKLDHIDPAEGTFIERRENN